MFQIHCHLARYARKAACTRKTLSSSLEWASFNDFVYPTNCQNLRIAALLIARWVAPAIGGDSGNRVIFFDESFVIVQ
jgi:hypothetical protein